MVWRFVIPVFLVALSSLGQGRLGTLETFRENHPGFFLSNQVERITIEKVPYYFFSGMAEPISPGADTMAIEDGGLWHEAEAAARHTLLSHLKMKSALLRGVICEYRVADGNVRRVVCSVAVDDVVPKGVSPSKARKVPVLNQKSLKAIGARLSGESPGK